MARTDAGALLTVQHRRAQMVLRAAALRDYMRVWPLWAGTPETFERLIGATVPVLRAHHRLSATVAAAYYQSFRVAERPGGRPTPTLASLDEDAAVTALVVTGRIQTAKAILAGQTPQAAMQTALVRTSGTVGRLVLAGGRDTLVGSTREDPRAAGYERVVSSGACDFCQELGAQGASDSDFEAHDHCACAAEPSFQ